jgi:hypothetical protein
MKGLFRDGGGSGLLAELLVVVVGILIALGIDQALANRSDRALEYDYLISLRDDFRATVEWIDNYGLVLNRRTEAELLGTQSVLGGSVDPEADSVAFTYTLGLAGFYPVLPIPSATYQDLTSTGNIRVIRDAALRRQLVDFYSWVEIFSVGEAANVERTSEARREISGILGTELTSRLSDFGYNAGPDAWLPPAGGATPELRSLIANSDVPHAARASEILPTILAGLVADIHFQRRQYDLVGGRARNVLASLDSLVGAF